MSAEEKIEEEYKKFTGLSSDKDEGSTPWVMIVDDDIQNLRSAGSILAEAGFKVSSFGDGSSFLDFVIDGNIPDLVLLDVMMPGMNGFETLVKFRDLTGAEEIPVVFLTAVEDGESEAKGLSLGAIDFIKKPIVPIVLVARVKNLIELGQLHRNLAYEVKRKTRENEELLLQVVQAMADSIDAKDTYTNGHSRRVAEYSREIAKRYGYDEDQQNEIYMIGILHDVGKIGVPDEVINKPAKL
nr:response regulator [Lachnospiraceae bacterium]